MDDSGRQCAHMIRSLFVPGRFNTTFQLSNTAINRSVAEGVAPTKILRYNTDGTVQEVGGGTTTSESSPWSDRNGEDGTGHHIRIASHDTGTNRYTGAPTIGTWTALSSLVDFDFLNSDTTGPYTDVSTYTIELSDDAGSTTLDSMTLTVTLSNDGP